MGGNIPEDSFLGGNFPGGAYQGGVWLVGTFRVGVFLITFLTYSIDDVWCLKRNIF